MGLAWSRLLAVEIAPIGPGPFAIGSTHLEVTPQPGRTISNFIKGEVTAKGVEYLTDILVHPADVPMVTIEVPHDPALYGSQSGTRIPVVLLVLYPTSTDNPRPRYTFPYPVTGGWTLPHMQRAGDRPIFASTTGKYPLIVHSSGYNTRGLWHLDHLKTLAAHGYIVVDIFHGDGRGASITGNTALRPLELRATIDYLLAHPDFGPAIDAEQIGVSGQSAGGHTVLATMGGIDPSGRIPSTIDPRIKAGVGLIPFMGGTIGAWPLKTDLWFFGSDFAGLRGITKPFLAIYGEKDSNVSRVNVEAGIRQVSGPATAVMLHGETHDVSDAANTDIYTWEILFFDTWLRHDPRARTLLESATNVRGGVIDLKTFEHRSQQAPH